MDTKRKWLIASGVCAVMAVGSGVLLAHNVVVVVPKAYGSSADLSTYWDKISVILSALSATGFTVSGIVTAIIAAISKGTAAIVDKVAPNSSVDTKAKTVDITTIGSIQIALTFAKDQPTRTSLITAGRAAFDDLRDRTFAVPMPEVTQ